MTPNPTPKTFAGKLAIPIDKVDASLLRVSSMARNPRFIASVLAQAAKHITPMVREIVLSNYAKTGLGQKSSGYKQEDKIPGVLAKTRVYLNFKGGDLRLRISTPPEVTPFKNQKDKPNGFYEAFASLNYGAVHGATEKESAAGKMQKILGIRARKTLKKMTAGMTINRVASRRLTRKLAALKAITGKDVAVREAYRFFEVSVAQAAQIKISAISFIRERFAQITRRDQGSQTMRKVA